jgi:DUF1680 family protein
MTAVVDTSSSPHARVRPVPIEAVRLEDGFWAPRQRALAERILPTQYRLCEETGRISNFRRAAKKAAGDFRGYFFNDSDVYKWAEAVGFALATAGGIDRGLSGLLSGVIDEIAAAQDDDGYLNTYFTFDRAGERWTNLRDMHELYCAGHLMQAAVAIHRSTGDRKLLDVACRFADHIAGVFGPGKRRGACGHPEVEMALVELYRETGRRNYLDIALEFLNNRGRGVLGGGENLIDHRPFRELEDIAGHAVRSLYLNSGAADIYMETGEVALLDALDRLWRSLTEMRMYVTGGAGSRPEGEAFGPDYDLPNATAYAETCAAIANVMWNWRMFLITGDAKYVDVLELALYNGVLSGISLDGERYFYVNPLADRGDRRRQVWFPCACCPPNIARLLASVQGYVYGRSGDGIWVNLFAQGKGMIQLPGNRIEVTQSTEYPWRGEVGLTVEPEREAEFGLQLRVPGWCVGGADVKVNGRTVGTSIGGRFFELRRTWARGDTVQLSLGMPVERIESHPRIEADAGRIALRRGPFIYCFEQPDNAGFDVWDLALGDDIPLEARWEPDLLNGVMAIEGEGIALDADWSMGRLYRSRASGVTGGRSVRFKAIPYFAWGNREAGPMAVWVRSLGASGDKV